jgi:rare lipoprotein A
MITACGTKKKVKTAKPARIGSTETGIASWYGYPYHGRRAANGEIYDMERFTAAHRTLPFGTWVRVKNLTNDKTVDVRIQDRGPFVKSRVIDLSRAAAREVELLGPGTAKVRLTIIAASKVREPKFVRVQEPIPVPAPKAAELRTPEIPTPKSKVPEASVPGPELPEVTPASPKAIAPAVVEPELFAVQIGAFQDRTRAESLRAGMTEKYGAARIVVREGKPMLYRVLVGEEDSAEKADALAERMRTAGTSGFVVRLDVVPPEI